MLFLMLFVEAVFVLSAQSSVVRPGEEPCSKVSAYSLLAEPLGGLRATARKEMLQSIGDGGSEYLFLEIRDLETGEVPTDFKSDQSYCVRLSYRPGLKADGKPLFKYRLFQCNIAADYPYFGPTEKVGQLSAAASPPDTIAEYRYVYTPAATRAETMAEKRLANLLPEVLIERNVVAGEVVRVSYRYDVRRIVFREGK